MKNLLLSLMFGSLLLSTTASAIKRSESIDDLSAVLITHIVADFIKCSMPDSTEKIETILRQAAKEAGATPLEFTFHQFQPAGFSAVLILAESHISIHYWHKEKYATIDIMTCGTCDPMVALSYLKDQLLPRQIQYDEINRPCLPEHASVVAPKV